VWQPEKFQTAKVTFKVIQWHWEWCHLISRIQFPISVARWGYFVISWLTFDVLYLCAIFGDSRFSRSGNTIAGIEIESWVM